MDSGDESRILTVLRAGKTLHKEGETLFWDEFITLCANREGMAELLGVAPEKVSSWPSKIREHLDELQKSDAQNPSEPEDQEMIPTGDNGAVTTNVDPYLGELK